MSRPTEPIADLLDHSLVEAIMGRRARRFGMGMEIPSGPLAFCSRHDPVPLSETEQMLLVAAGLGVSGWSFGVPYGPDRPDEHAHYTERFTGRPTPTGAGIGTPALCFTDDSGTYFVDTRDCRPEHMNELAAAQPSDPLEGILTTCREQTVQLSDRRLDLPASPPHVLPPNVWMANAPGSTMFMPIADASEQVLGVLAMAIANGNVVIDDTTGGPAGNLDGFIRSGLLDETKRAPLSMLTQYAYEGNCAEVSFMAHNMVLVMQAMGLGGLYFNGLNRWSVLGAFAEQGIRGLGFRLVHDDRWPVPDPVGLDGHFEGLCPPYVEDMREAVEVFAQRKFGPGGAYDPETPGPWRHPKEVKAGVTPYSDEFRDCLATVAQHVLDTRGRFPDTPSTMVLSGYVQAVHLDAEFYDTHYAPGAYLGTHAEHLARWHPETVSVDR